MAAPSNDEPATDPIDPAGVALLVENHRAFLRYLQRRTGSRQVAEDILQDAFVRNLDRLDTVPDEALVPWFYRVLRNALIDRSRRTGAESRALAAFANELSATDAPSQELHQEICACIGRLVRTLKPEYAEALRAVDLDDVPVRTFAQTSGLSASNAGVRLFRARKALKQRVSKSCGTCAEHGCLDCSCGKPK